MPELRLVLTALALIAAMVLSAVVGRRQRVGIVLLVLLSFVWLTIDRYFEGGVILVVSSHHGLVTSDLVGIAGLGVAVWLWVRSRRSR
jgi:hypothetical protein